MSYTLVYAVNGHEHTIERDTLDEVNDAIRILYDESANTVILRVEENQDGPHTWQIEYPPAPPAGTRFRTKGGTVCTVVEGGRVERSGTSYGWKYVLEEFGPLTEVVETEVEAAARRLREANGDWDRADAYSTLQYWRDARTVLAHVLNGGQL